MGVGRAAAAGAEDVAACGDEREVGFGDVPGAIADRGGVGVDVDYRGRGWRGLGLWWVVSVG